VVTIHKRTIELQLRSGSGSGEVGGDGSGGGGTLLLKAVDEADCASWGRCLQDAARLPMEWRQDEGLESIM
jgi:hypothetical protein